MTTVLLPLAHAGEGATWQALLTLVGLGLAIVVLLVAAGLLRLEEPGDLILPLAGTAVLASLSGATSGALSDWVGWALPVGVTALVALLLVVFSPLRLGVASPLLWVTVAVAAVSAVLLQTPISRSWHPATFTPDSALVDDLAVEITGPEDGGAVPAGTVPLEVTATGGSLGPGLLAEGEQAPEDPEERVLLTITLFDPASGEQTSMPGRANQDCASGCAVATYDLEIPAGEWTIFIQARTADARPFGRAEAGDTLPSDSITVIAE